MICSFHEFVVDAGFQTEERNKLFPSAVFTGSVFEHAGCQMPLTDVDFEVLFSGAA